MKICSQLPKPKFAQNDQNEKLLKMKCYSKWTVAQNNQNDILLKIISDQKMCVLTVRVHHPLAKCFDQSDFDPPNEFSTIVNQEIKGK